ncbi:RNA exonuclease 4-like isoform X2 [Symsagittifera roscoffensis]
MPAPKILKRDRIFEKFLLDDQGYLIDGLETSDQKERSAFQKRDPERGEDHLRIPERIKETANSNRQLQLELPTSMMEPTKAVALDCEMVGALKAGSFSLLARVSIVNSHGHPLYDKYVKPEVDITDYRTELSGITAEKLSEKGEPLQKVQKEVAQLLKGRVVIGHAIPNDFKVLFLSHPKRDTRDTSMYPPFRKLASGPRKTPALRVLAEKILGIQIQSGEHDSIQDAQVAMKLYMTNRSKWECWLGRKLAKLKGKQELEVVEQDGSLSKGKEPRKRKRKKGRGSKSK